jgi:hypothetical protein
MAGIEEDAMADVVDAHKQFLSSAQCIVLILILLVGPALWVSIVLFIRARTVVWVRGTASRCKIIVLKFRRSEPA